MFESWFPPHVATEIRTQLADSIVPVTVIPDSLPVATEAPDPPTVRVYRGGSPWSGALVTFQTEDLGRVQSGYAISDADGLAAAGAWYIGSAPGSNVLVVRIPKDTVQFLVEGKI
jgi:hypothetical protein